MDKKNTKRTVMFHKKAVAGFSRSEMDEKEEYYKHKAPQAFLGRYYQNRTGNFGDNIKTDSDSPVPLEGKVGHEKTFVYGWVKKFRKPKKEKAQYDVSVKKYNTNALGKAIDWWRHYNGMWHEPSQHETYTVMFMKDRKKDNDYIPVMTNKDFDIGSKEAKMALGAIMSNYAKNPSTNMCDSDYRPAGKKTLGYRDPKSKKVVTLDITNDRQC